MASTKSRPIPPAGDLAFQETADAGYQIGGMPANNMLEEMLASC